MFDHLQIKVADLRDSRRFYVPLLAALKYEVVLEIEGVVVGIGIDTHNMFEIRQAGSDAPLTTSVHVAFSAPSKTAVDQFYAKALQMGAKDNGPPGFRPEYEDGYYAAFVIDPNGHNLEAVWTSEEPSARGARTTRASGGPGS